MVGTQADSFVHYYQRELSYLRRASQSFAAQYPKIAQRLELGPAGSADPHVERLIESFAYLTAGLQQEIDDKFSHITTALLSVLYPQYVNPLPAMTIATFEPKDTLGRFTSIHTVPKGTQLFSRATHGEVCYFQTAYPVDLWPLHLEKAEIIVSDSFEAVGAPLPTGRVLKLRLKSKSGPFQDLKCSTLRFYLSGDRALQNTLYEMLFSQDNGVFTLYQKEGDRTPTCLRYPTGNLKPVGFNPQEDSLIPLPAQAHPAYGLLFEYFNFPQKFFFFDLHHLDRCPSGEICDILIPIPDGITVDAQSVDHRNFLLGCTPIINLFSKVSEPLRLDQRSLEYRLVADYQREKTTEIHSIRDVKMVIDQDGSTDAIAPYFSCDHHGMEKGQKMFWYGRRQASTTSGVTGADFHLSFVDLNFDPQKPPDKTIYAHILCTNRALAENISSGAVLDSEESVPAKMTCLERPTQQVSPPTDGETQWRLISQLSLTHMSLVSGDQGVKSLKEMLRLYANLTQTRRIPELEDLLDLTAHPVARRFGQETWRGFVQGTAITLTFAEKAFSGGGGFLLSSVLNQFFGLYAAVNSFTELSIKKHTHQELLKTWAPNVGDTPLL